ncbi:MAG: hypothetical protein AMDU3_IPLC00003G0030 [Thermoplasmatales archaeon I-plasma]|jgi:hypothetical protein|nr:MAG: hypothetical protein AMDU3_IPLC00003G0030 [Thermoplasmatales archaeon I-plasma]
MRILICGSRYDIDEDKVRQIIEDIVHNNPDEEYMHGGAVGVDSMADSILKSHGITPEVVKPDYELHGNYAPLERDNRMVDVADEIHVLWNGRSRGSQYVMRYAKAHGKATHMRVYDVSRKVE